VIKIIGAGIAGSYAAFQAARKKIKVKVLERAPKELWERSPLIGRMCGEGVWLRKLEAANIKINLDKLPGFVENVTTTLNLAYLVRERKISFSSKGIEPYLLLNRKRFIDWMRQEALKLGAVFHFSAEISDVKRLENKKQDDFIIAAWGSNLTLTSQIVKRNYRINYVLACQYTLRGVNSAKISNGKTIVLTNDPRVRYFYIFPKGPGSCEEANVGVALNAPDIQSPFKILKEFLGYDPLGCFTRAKVIPERTFAKKLIFTLPLTQSNLTTKFVLPIGDAGGQISALSGGGIGYSLLGAINAVNALLDPAPLNRYYSLIGNLIKRLRKEYQMSEKLYPKNKEAKRRINNRFMEAVKKGLKKERYLSLSNVIENLFSNSVN